MDGGLCLAALAAQWGAGLVVVAMGSEAVRVVQYRSKASGRGYCVRSVQSEKRGGPGLGGRKRTLGRMTGRLGLD